ncbi:hypothetical protein MVI27_09450 [Chryseobacterium salipaludis]|uniref:hypothetical protein n=1 Tax=Chryseobacterium TaxID=59732 RepID=UPI001FF664C4|nr:MULTISPECIES: hypothetical protein [Chryseobacterium]MCJ8498485.1 hypothetical protein [Chryseobacterium salipaludis]MCX3297190.1 hypothetical protein [Planobacterium sp. JC490]
MKKLLILPAAVVLFTMGSCDKKNSGNAGVLKADETTAVTGNSSEEAVNERTDRYVAEDGSSALVTFKEAGGEKSISIRSNNKTIAAPLKEAEADKTVYGNYDFEIVSKKDSITITQGDNVISLKRARSN